MAKRITKKMFKKMDIVARMVLALRPLYAVEDDEQKRNMILTTVGAAIFYISSSGLDSGVSIALKDGDKGVKDHYYSRHLAAKELIESDKSYDDILELLPALISVNHITKEEHIRVTKLHWRKLDITPEEYYQRAGIELRPVKEPVDLGLIGF